MNEEYNKENIKKQEEARLASFWSQEFVAQFLKTLDNDARKIFEESVNGDTTTMRIGSPKTNYHIFEIAKEKVDLIYNFKRLKELNQIICDSDKMIFTIVDQADKIRQAIKFSQERISKLYHFN